MTINRLSFVIGALLATSFASAQSWRAAYENGLAAAHAQNWSSARAAFKEAMAFRPEDQSKPTSLPGPASDRRQWRNGAPYSPNFLAAYSEYRMGVGEKPAAREQHFRTALNEFDTLLKKGQTSKETFFFASASASQLGDVPRRDEINARMAKATLDWKVDNDPVTPEEMALVNGSPTDNGNIIIPSNPTQNPVLPTTNGVPSVPTTVASDSTKFALLIGNSESKLTDLAVPFAADDAQLVRRSLITSAGYQEKNVDLVINASSKQMLTGAKALADRMPEGATLVIYFSGVGTNVDGKDFFSGTDAEALSNVEAMVSKSDLYAPFLAKGARIFCFCETNRPINAGRFFGMEVPYNGAVAQTQATLPGDTLGYTRLESKNIGIYAVAFCSALADLKTNRVPITEFGWQVYYKIRRGDSGSTGGSSHQTPTLPVLNNLASDAKF